MESTSVSYQKLEQYAEENAKISAASENVTMNMSQQCLNRRSKAIRWIYVITDLSGCDVDTKDTCIMTFDKYILSYLFENKKCTEDSNFMSLSAAACTLIGTKIHYSKKSLTVESFPYFKPHDLVSYERSILEKIDYDVDPSLTPSSFMRYMLCVWPNCLERHDEILREAFELVASFWLSAESTLYSPMTIAVAALLLALNKLDIDSSDWLNFVPSCCLSLVDQSGRKVVDKCLESFRRPNSPTTVTAHIESKLNISPPVRDDYSVRKRPNLHLDEQEGGSSATCFKPIERNGWSTNRLDCIEIEDIEEIDDIRKPVPITLNENFDDSPIMNTTQKRRKLHKLDNANNNSGMCAAEDM